MNNFSALSAYRLAWNRRLFVVPVFLAVRLLSVAIIAPLTALAMTLAVSLSGQSALTDRDIAHFLLTPTGFPALVLVASIFLVGSVIGFAAMTVDLRFPQTDGFRAIPSALNRVAWRLPSLLGFALLLTLKVLAIAAPFLLVGFGASLALIGTHDINFYLAEKPPEFLIFAGLCFLLLLAMAGVLLNRALSWAVALHLVLFSGAGPRQAFSQSQTHMASRKMPLARQILIWLGIRFFLSALTALSFSFVLDTAARALDVHLHMALAILMSLAVIWLLADAIVAAISLGALAVILNGCFDGSSKADDAGLETLPAAPMHALAAAFALIIVAGLVVGSLTLGTIRPEHDVEVIAHRGAAGTRPENTSASVRKAVEDGADWVEVDVQETADGEVVVIHDSDFMKLSGVDLKIWDATAAELEHIDIGSWFDPRFASERTPTLTEVLEIVRDRAKLLIELKYYGHDVDLEARTAARIEAAGMSDQTAIMSLSYPAVQKMRDMRPNWRAGVLAATAIGDLAALDGDFVAVNASRIGPRLVAATDSAGKDLYAWTVNEPMAMSAMISMGVDGIITDEPALLRKVLAMRADLDTSQRLFLLLAERFGLSLPTGGYRDASP